MKLRKHSTGANILESHRNELKNAIELRLMPKLLELEADASPENLRTIREKMSTCLEKKSAFAPEIEKIERDLEVNKLSRFKDYIKISLRKTVAASAVTFYFHNNSLNPPSALLVLGTYKVKVGQPIKQHYALSPN